MSQLNSNSSYQLSGFLFSATLHLSVGALALFWQATTPTILDNTKAEIIHWVSIEKLALKSQVPNPVAKSKHLMLAPKSVAKNIAAPAQPKVQSQVAPAKKIVALTKKTNTPAAPQQETTNTARTNSDSSNASNYGTAPYNAAAQEGPVRASYEQAVLQRLEKVKNYPQRALRRRLEGDVVLLLNISASGSVLKSQINNTSGFEFFDEEVLAMVKRVGSFPAFPEDISSNNLSFIIPVSFRLQS